MGQRSSDRTSLLSDRVTPAQAGYYRQRADAHAMLAARAAPPAAPIHEALAAAYRSAAWAAERGEAIDFSGHHRAERPDWPPADDFARMAAE